MQQRRNRLTEIYSIYYPVMFSAVNAKVCNTDDTQDICQEIFTRLYERLDEVENVRRWLFSAMKFVILEYFRSRKKNEALNIDDVFQDISLTFVNGFRDTRMLIEEAMSDKATFADETERVIFDLIAFNDLTYEMAAKQIGMTRRQIEYRYTQVVERIVRFLKGKGINSLEEIL